MTHEEQKYLFLHQTYLTVAIKTEICTELSLQFNGFKLSILLAETQWFYFPILQEDGN